MKELLLKRKNKFILYVIACFIPVISQIAFNTVIALMLGSIEKKDLDYFKKIIILTVIIVIFSSILFLISRFMRISYMRDTILDVRLKAFDKIMRSSYKNFSKKSKDSYISNLINDINIFENTFFLNLINVIFSLGIYVVSIAILLYLDYKFSLMVIGFSLILFFVSNMFSKKTIKLQEEVSENNENFVVDIANTFNGIEILKLNNIEDKFLKRVVKSIFGLERKKLMFKVFTDSQQRILYFFLNLNMVAVLYYLTNLICNGQSLTKVMFMMQIGNGCVWHISSGISLLNQLKSSNKIYNKITINEEENNDIKLNKTEDFSFNSEINVENLSFKYDEKDVFKNVSFTIERGKKYLLKGASGCGKSTLIKILSMVYDDYEGKITLDDVDYKTIKEESLNENVSFIYQDVFLFEDTIFNNITLFKFFKEEEVLKACEKAGLNTLLNKKENGLYEMLSENGKNLSGGERQRISIARAILKDCKILFVDEGTSSLDENLGRTVENTILNLDSTVIAISHRYYEGISEKYDYVLEVKNGFITQYKADEYFQEVAI